MRTNTVSTMTIILLLDTVIVSAVAELRTGPCIRDLAGWQILTPPDAIPSEKFTAGELQDFVHRAAGLQLSLGTADGPKHKSIWIGPLSANVLPAGQSLPQPLGQEDYRIEIKGDSITIAGGRPRGVLYGTYSFLEERFGVRFLTAQHTHVPAQSPDKRLPTGVWSYHPPFAYRFSSFRGSALDPAFAARCRTNALTAAPRFGGTSSLKVINHSFDAQIPSSVYGDRHPEYYALVEGRRMAPVENDAYQTQLCMTNPKVIDMLTKAARAELQAAPDSRVVSISQNDNGYYCRCKTCVAIDAREGSAMGSLLAAVNAVADRIRDEYPDVEIGTLAYQYSRRPPARLKPRDNVRIQLCSIECCILHALDDPKCAQNQIFYEDLKDWGRITNNLNVWHYNANFKDYLLPLPNLRTIGTNLRLLAANQVDGVYMQAVHGTQTPGDAGAMWELRHYVTSRLLWNPDQDAEELIDEFIRLHYGPAGGPINQYITLIHQPVNLHRIHRRCFARAADYGLGEDTAMQAVKLFEKAMTLADSTEIKQRVEKASISAYRLAIEPVWPYPDSLAPDVDTCRRLRPSIERFLYLADVYHTDYVGAELPAPPVFEKLRVIVSSSNSSN